MLEIFKNENFTIRTTGTKDNPLFVAMDVCKALEILNPRDAIKTLREKSEGVVLTDTLETVGGEQKANVLTEQGLYMLIMQSRKPSAIDFQLWVTGEVLPSIRKTGKYELKKDSYMIDNPIERAKAWIVEEEVREKLQLENNLKSEKIERDKPKVIFAEAIECSVNACLIGTWIKSVEITENVKIGQNRAFKWLRENKYLISDGRRKNNPMQKYIDNGYFELKLGSVVTPRGTRETFTTLITGKGQVALVQKIMGISKNK